MIKYVLKRLLMMIPVMLGVLTIAFILNELTPGDAATALAGSEALTAAGFGEDVQVLLENLTLPSVAMVLVVGILVALAAGPLNGSAAIIALGSIAYAAMVNVGVEPVRAVVATLIFASTEGASPPSSAAIFISCSIAEEDDVRVTFKPLVFHYVIPITCVGMLVALGVLPIVGG